MHRKYQSGKFILRLLTIFLAVVVVVLIIMFVHARSVEKEALRKAKTATEESRLAAEQRKDAIIQRRIAEQQQQIAEQQKIITEEQREFAIRQQYIADRERFEAIRQRQIAEEATERAIEARDDAEAQRKEAIIQKQHAEEAKINAELSESQAKRLRLLAVARTLAIQSTSMQGAVTDDLPALLALQAFKINKENNGNIYDPDIYLALTGATSETVVLRGHEDEVRGICAMEEDKSLASCSLDGTVIIWDITGTGILIGNYKLQNEQGGFYCLAYSPEGNKIACGHSSGKIMIIDTKQPLESPVYFSGHTDVISSVAFSKSGTQLASCSYDGSVRIWDMTAKVPTWIEIYKNPNLRIYKVIFSPDGEIIFWSNEKGEIFRYHLKSMSPAPQLVFSNDYPIKALAISREGTSFAAGNTSGNIWLWKSTDFNEEPQKLIGHISGINALCFCPVKSRLASCSYDRTIRIWNASGPEDQPLIIEDHDAWIYSIAFTQNGNELISAGADKSIYIRSVNPEILAGKICSTLSRNLTQTEWNKYIGGDIEYQKTCENIP